MRELSIVEIQTVAGAGFIKDGLSSIGGNVGNFGYNLISSYLNVQLPVLGNVNLSNLLPTLGKDVGTAIGSQVGGQIESTLTSLPLVGGVIGKILG
ncbi:hypothetical protein [Commensalibacter communis]|nr:hypothetical protein [Commensalibacter communis]